MTEQPAEQVSQTGNFGETHPTNRKATVVDHKPDTKHTTAVTTPSPNAAQKNQVRFKPGTSQQS
jgi:hypothetical protein